MEGSPFKPKMLKLRLSLITFGQILPKILPVVSILSYTIMTYLNLAATKSLNAKQRPVGLSPRITLFLSPFLSKMHHTFNVSLFPSELSKICSYFKMILNYSNSLDFLNWCKSCFSVLHLVSILYE